MAILLIGANGGVGSQLVKQFKAQNEDFTAGVRKEEQVSKLQDEGIQAIQIDVEKDDIDTLIQTFKQFDTIIFSVGSGGSTGADKTIIVDLDGAIKTMIASKEAKINHYVMVSTYDSRRQAFDASGDLKPYTIAKHYADHYLRASGLNYTIVHPGVLTNDAGTGQIDAGLYFEGKNAIPREDVARVLNEVSTSNQYMNQEFQIIAGDKSITEALASYRQK
ncbi:SDR family oxidoreductase [Staphylococcus lugdunensis]|jgi:uncharacterized protein YbjT (DUF2867 family)|uniref:SDR family oxidoreductase n=1 Tax=Staphylococcus lugdunensis TaxID=28035 RepID=A0A292DJH5_STALU|nr:MULTISPECIES: SDR family oxidoreductase [Staphylococcus]ADC87009.1 oxidoreductase ylbE [Staphylococcus lugdunensis HKU09-01]AMG62431.1 oxidoreductase [Staphylococcus lugdunensis]AMG63646.1 SDR family NAD(P)-dependent oxidoreductase [Staphylococcus lugdunensis]ARJ10961.1 oxidoreductase [Staphylococcus lugdunensis]ARJ15819.1 oxidoreductase [Staphylococcus lugdunensis]